VLGDALAGAVLVTGTLLDVRGGGADATVGEPDERTLGAAVLGTGVTDAVAVAAGHRAP
jgi:hypothetical protein